MTETVKRPTMHFYVRGLPTCDTCRKPAAYEILGSGNSRYGYACKGCKNKHIKRLDKAHNHA